MNSDDSKKAKYELVNIYDDVVRSTVKALMDAEQEMCKCDKCYLDACVYVFNKGFTRFSTSSKGNVIAGILEMNKGKQAELRVLAAEAVNAVKNNPDHSE